ncbi:hypothetical protein KIW84_062102 [Lathyrus oleraceus]|uniref:Uncharacterized protein n=1 Tax=Pisum sativum TaxID=3888 RepID=A0A9D4W7Q6_PEA|nr:hypothetical protein KIW84_062102 [Pisum sativum]
MRCSIVVNGCQLGLLGNNSRKQNPNDFVDECYTREKYALCYRFSVSPINGQAMSPEVQTDELQPPVYKNGPGRSRKVRIRECGEYGARRRRPGIAYKFTKCDKFGHNALSCKSLTQDPNALKRKSSVQTNIDVQSSVQINVDVQANVDIHANVNVQDHVDASQVMNNVVFENNLVHIYGIQVK